MWERGHDKEYNAGDMRRRLFTIFSAVSLVLCVAMCVMWVRSYWVNDSFYSSRWWPRGLTSNESAWWLLTGRGVVGIGHRVQQAVESPVQMANFKPLFIHRDYSWKRERPATPLRSSQASEGIFRRHGFRYEDDPFVLSGVNGYYRECDAPLWAAAVLFAIIPAAQLLTARKRRRLIGEHCRKCGYDLRATTDRCPECGRAATTKGTMAAP
jgi:hypothetical protein